MGFIQAHGGITAVIGVSIVIFNITMSAISSVFSALHQMEPGWLQTLGSIGLKATQWTTANTPTPPKSNGTP